MIYKADIEGLTTNGYECETGQKYIVGRINKVKKISISSCKGGSAKTMTTVSASGILAEDGKKVLIIDLDPQANATNNLGVDELKVKFTIKDVFENPKLSAEDVICKAPVENLPSLDLIPSTVMLTATELKINSQAGREFILRNFFKKNEEILSRYDYIFFDTNPYMLTINQNAYVICDSIILTAACGMNNLKGVELFQGLWETIRDALDIEDNVKGVLVTKYDSVKNLHKEFMEYIKNRNDLKHLLFDSVIPTNVRLEETEVEARPINVHDKTSKGYIAYRNFVNELIKRV